MRDWIKKKVGGGGGDDKGDLSKERERKRDLDGEGVREK